MLKLENINKIFNEGTVNEQRIFEGLDFSVKSGDFITILGSNGAGKSTLLNLIAGTHAADKGKIILADKDITKLKEHQRAKFIGRVFQNPTFGTSPSMTILENLSLALNKGKTFGLSLGVNKKNITYFREILTTLNLGLEDKLNIKVGALSGGQRQSLSLLMATLVEPQLLLLDEHTAALDPKTSALIMELTNNIVQEKKITTLMITHNLNHAISYGSRLIMLHKGKVILDICGEEKSQLTINKLVDYFDSIKCSDALSDELMLA
ncbi:ABC transporter ATP-binding protein [Clostridium polyendosporum]|uniref:ABC transporter ATP-binding protein n=1 Tax=Clostridium polyendosporum TaxID=69208 RepID=A0A919VGA8_9CLOT|nr:ATP-binding cassette domain-containing protein [Clostridium polyendosporum]GIM28997.1 ABC transporter ATP-binding protein [Clostridium polyendosporum]